MCVGSYCKRPDCELITLPFTIRLQTQMFRVAAIDLPGIQQRAQLQSLP